jgi:hypothetical protein
LPRRSKAPTIRSDARMQNWGSDLTRMFRLTSLIAAITWLGTVIAPSQQAPGLNPTLELEKTAYAADESIRFWIGLTSASEIPEALRSSCLLHWTRPDGSRHDEQVGWPLDGDPSHGWQGGWGFGKQDVSLGRYVVSFECAGRQTKNQSFEIVSNPSTSGIHAQWIFVDSKAGGRVRARSAFLHLENGTGRVLRFAKPGLVGSEIWLQVRTLLPPSIETTFIPQPALLRADEIPSFSFQKVEWGTQSKWPMIAVAPGGSSDRTVDLQSAYPFRNEQEYEVTIETVLTVFLGESEDSDAGLFPLRIPVSTTTHFRW